MSYRKPYTSWDNSIRPGDSFRPWKNTGCLDLGLACFSLPQLMRRAEKHKSLKWFDRMLDKIELLRLSISHYLFRI